MLNAAFWKAATERAVKTFAQTVVALIGAQQVNIIDLNWPSIAGIAATAAALSVFTSIASSPVGEQGPSLGQETDIIR